MSQILKLTDWQSASGNWYANDLQDLTSPYSKWWAPARMLGLPLTDYILLLKNEYHAIIDGYNSDTDVLIFHWDNSSDCHKFVLYVNKKAKG